MRHKLQTRRFDRASSTRSALIRGLVTDLLDHEKLTTTEAKAREIQRTAERLITLSKKNNLSARRQALAFIYKTEVVEKMFADIGPRYAQRPGGYTRLTKLMPRLGDGAPMAVIELVK